MKFYSPGISFYGLLVLNDIWIHWNIDWDDYYKGIEMFQEKLNMFIKKKCRNQFKYMKFSEWWPYLQK